MPQTQSERSTGVRIDSCWKLAVQCSRCDSRAKLRSDLQNTSRPSNWRSTSTLVKATSWAEIHLSNTDSTSRTKVHLCSAEQPLARRSQHLHFALSATRLHQLAFRGFAYFHITGCISQSEIDLSIRDRPRVDRSPAANRRPNLALTSRQQKDRDLLRDKKDRAAALLDP